MALGESTPQSIDGSDVLLISEDQPVDSRDERVVTCRSTASRHGLEHGGQFCLILSAEHFI
jgi:hypothetical protein